MECDLIHPVVRRCVVGVGGLDESREYARFELMLEKHVDGMRIQLVKQKRLLHHLPVFLQSTLSPTYLP